MRSKQQFKPKHLARVLFGPVFRKSFAWMTIGVISLHSTQTLFLDYYKEYLGSNTSKGAKPLIPLPQHIQDIISEVFTDLMKSKRLMEDDLKKIDIVLSQDAEQPFHKGNLHSLNGSFIGLPSSFSDSYTSSESHWSQNSTGKTHSPGKIKNTKQQNAANTKHMQKASVLWEKNAIKYAIMKECLKTDSHDLQIRSTLQAVFVCFYAMVLQWSSVRFRQISVCLVYAGLWAALFGTVLSQQWIFYHAYLEEQADNDIVSLGGDFLEGGLSYYSRVIEHNKMSKDRRQYDEEGNPKQRFFIKKCLSYTKKKEFFKEKLKEKEN